MPHKFHNRPGGLTMEKIIYSTFFSAPVSSSIFIYDFFHGCSTHRPSHELLMQRGFYVPEQLCIVSWWFNLDGFTIFSDFNRAPTVRPIGKTCRAVSRRLNRSERSCTMYETTKDRVRGLDISCNTIRSFRKCTSDLGLAFNLYNLHLI